MSSAALRLHASRLRLVTDAQPALSPRARASSLRQAPGTFFGGSCLGSIAGLSSVGHPVLGSSSYPWAPNKSFKPNLLRYSKSVAEKACHAFASTTQVGLTQVLDRSESQSMTIEMTVQQACSIISSAFSPLRCVAEPWDYEYRVRFRVFDGAEPLLVTPELLKPQVTDARRLESIINQARSRLAERGYTLDPWAYPNDQPPV